MITLRILLALALAQAPSPHADADLTPAEVANQQRYDQPLRPQFHYTPIQGHIGDATGLIYYRGEYHLFNMYDEWSRQRLAHKRWGHAVSNDLVHWTQLPAILDTQLDNQPGSGSGVVDWNNSSKLRRGPEKTLLIFYTDYKLGTCIAISYDRGRSWVRYGSNPVIAGAVDARDPTVFWYEPASQWRMIRYEKKGFAFYKSDDLLHWEWLSRVDGYYECPDLVELPVLNATGEHRWVLIDGDASYVIGNFDGQRFIPQTEKLRVEYGSALYATQTWKRSMEPGRSYQIGWMRYPLLKSITWNGQMSFPVELTLRQFPEGIRLCREPVDEINNLRIAQNNWNDFTVSPGERLIPEAREGLLDISTQMKPHRANEFGLTINGHAIHYSMVDQKLRLDSFSAPLKLTDGELRLRILVDRSSIEVFADQGQVTLSAVTLDNPNHGLALYTDHGSVQVLSLTLNHLESIWENASGDVSR
jgi:fructan beta-fructosidase